MIRMGQGKLTENLYRSSLETLKTAAKVRENQGRRFCVQQKQGIDPTMTGLTMGYSWVNYNDLTATSLEIMVSKGNHPQMALIQVSELL